MPTVTSSFRRSRRALAILVACFVAGPVLVFGPMARAETADGVAADDRSRIQSVRFEFENVASAETGDATRIARYRSMTVAVGGEPVELRPLTGTVRVSMSRDDAEVMTAELNGTRHGAGVEDFGDRVASATTSDSANSNLHITPREGGPASVDVFFSRALGASDYLLVQEAGGDSIVTLTPIAGDGTVVGDARQVGPDYQWNTGHPSMDGQPTWASVLPVAAFGSSFEGFRLSAEAAQVKVLALAIADPEPLVVTVEQPSEAVPNSDSAPVEAAAATGSDHGDNPPLTEAQPAVVPPNVVSGPQVVSAPQAVSEPQEVSAPQGASGPQEASAPVAAAPAITQLAMTGNLTEPWLVVALAMGIIFIGYTVYAAYRLPARRDAAGHDQLDQLGFD